MKRPRRELGLRLELNSAQLRRAKSRSTLEGLVCSAPERERLHSVYFDTRDRALRSKGLSLHLRQVGDSWMQTLEADSASVDGAPDPIELETAIEGKLPVVDAISDKALRRQVKRLVDQSKLVAVFETTIDRNSRRLTNDAGDEIALALDDATVSARSRKERFRLADIELKAGNPAALIDIAKRISADGPLRVRSLSEADAGYRLIGEQRKGEQRPVKARQPSIDPRQPVREAMLAIFRAATVHILHNWQALVETDDPEAAHQLRVGLRRLRAALRILRAAADHEGMRALDRRVRDLGRVVGGLRDMDVLLAEIVAPLAGMANVAHGIEVVCRRLAHERRRCRSQVLDALGTRELGLLRLELGLLPCTFEGLARAGPGPLDKPAAPFARKALRKLLDRVAKRGRRLDELTTEERHELRKTIKSLRYGLEFFAPLYPSDEVRRLVACAAELQDVLGYLNDVALAERLQAMDWHADADGAEAIRAIGAAIGWHAAKADQAWGDAKAAWKHFERAAKLLD